MTWELRERVLYPSSEAPKFALLYVERAGERAIAVGDPTPADGPQPMAAAQLPGLAFVLYRGGWPDELDADQLARFLTDLETCATIADLRVHAVERALGRANARE